MAGSGAKDHSVVSKFSVLEIGQYLLKSNRLAIKNNPHCDVLTVLWSCSLICHGGIWKKVPSQDISSRAALHDCDDDKYVQTMPSWSAIIAIIAIIQLPIYIGA